VPARAFLLGVRAPLRLRCLTHIKIRAGVASFSDDLQTAQVMIPAGLMPGSDIPTTRKIAVRQAEDCSIAVGRQGNLRHAKFGCGCTTKEC